mmetsp:Transcript_38905/g.70104  ORF Transcript_38905/g.70104 Transcript_38905/m.70104 type:complete len:487 (+) Transcript_38905:157-1617(+)
MLMKRRHMYSLLHLIMMMLLLVMLLLHRRLFLLLFMCTMTLIPTVSIAGIEAKSKFRELQRPLGGHLRLLTFLVFLVVDALGVDPCAELARVLGHDCVSKFGLIYHQLLQPLIPTLIRPRCPLGALTPLKDEAHLLQRRQPLGCHRARLALRPILVIPSCQLDKASQLHMIYRNTTMSILLEEFPQALHLIVPRGVRSTRTELKAEFGEALHFDGVEAGAFPGLAGDELVVHATLGGYPVGKFGAGGGGYVAIAVFSLVIAQPQQHLTPPNVKVPTRDTLSRYTRTSSTSRTTRHTTASTLKAQRQQPHGLIVGQSRALALQMSAQDFVLARHPRGQEGIVTSGYFDVAILGLVLDDFDVHVFPGGGEIHAQFFQHIRLLLRHAHIMTLPPPNMQIPLILSPLPQRRQLLLCLLRTNLNRAILLLVLPEFLQHAQPLGPDGPVLASASIAHTGSGSTGLFHLLNFHLGSFSRPTPFFLGSAIHSFI